MLEENIGVIQNVIIENRKKLNISGVKDVTSFDEETILVDTALGKMTIKGEDLRIESFDTATGDLSAVGKVYAVVYMTDARVSGGFLSRLFR
ncbi:MAG: sporulation protein YabP [Clostridia bacterium]|nr:sporulation protein YabP [Clostridia bacterium]